LPQRMEYLIPQEAPQEEAVPEAVSPKFANQETVENIGQRIRQLRESRGMTQSQLQSKSKVSRSYLSRIESGQMTPSLGTLEKISEALNVGLNRFFIPESDGEALLEDPFIQGLRPFLRQLDWEQWQSILKRLQAISDHVNAAPINLRPIGNPARLPQPAPANGNGQHGHIGHASHSNGLIPAPAHGQPQGYPLRPTIQIPQDATSVTIDSTGVVTVKVPDQTDPVEAGRIELADFLNPSGLKPIGDNLFVPTNRSGDALQRRPGEDNAGTLAQGFTEGSNVKLAEEFVNLVVAQRAYEANAKAIQVADEMLSISNNMRR